MTRSIKAVILCTILCLATILDPTDARKSSSGSSRRTGSGSVSSGRVTKPQGYANPNIAALSYGPGQAAQPRPQASAPKPQADPSIAQLSYGGNQPAISKQSAPVQHAAPPVQHAAPPPQSAPSVPSAPVLPPQAPPLPAAGAGSRPIGWNVDGNQAAVNKPPVNSAPYPSHNSAPYPAQNSAPYPAQNSAPYPVASHNGPPPAYSQYPNAPPPAYHPQGGAPPQGYPAGAPPPYSAGGYPAQSYPGGHYPAPNNGYPAQPIGGQPQVVNNYYGAQNGGKTGGLGGSGLQTALLAGVGGLALYGALKPSETKTIIIDNTAHVVPLNATVPEGATVLPVNATLPPGVALAPLQVATEGPVLLAAYPGMENATTTVNIPQSTPASSSDVPMSPSDAYSTTESILLAGYPSTGLYPSLPVSVPADNVGVRVDVPTTTGVPLAPYPETPKPIALASLHDTSTPKPAHGSASSVRIAFVLFLPLVKFLL